MTRLRPSQSPTGSTPGVPRISRRTAVGLAVTGSTAMTVTTLGTHATRANQRTRGADPASTPVAGDGSLAEIELAVRTAVHEAVASTWTPGAIVLIRDSARGELTITAGLADLSTGRAVTPNDHFRIASVTKTFTATVILQLVEEGAVRLDDILETFVPGIANGDRITVRQVLDMSAGIFNWVTDPVFKANFDRDPLLVSTPQEAVEIVRQHPADFEPGERVQYSDTNYILLGLIIEQVTGLTAADAITERVIRPLGLDSTTFALDETVPAGTLRGYSAAETGAILTDVTLTNPDIPWTAGAMISTVADMATWARALATGTLLTPELHRQQLETGLLEAGPVEARYGLGLLTINGLIGHNGGIFGYNSWVLHDPDRDASLVIVTNRANNEGGTANAIFAAIVPLLFPERFPSPA